MADLAALREWSPGAKEEPSHDDHVMIRYLRAGLLTGELRPVWRCSCDPVNQCGIYDPTRDERTGQGSPEQHKKKETTDE